MINLRSPGISHADLEPSRIRKNETNVKSIGDTLDKNWANPVSVPNELASLSTSSVAPESVQQDILNAKEQGEHAHKSFCMERLMSNQPSKHFDNRLQKLKLKTFSDVKKSRKVKASNKAIILKADHKVFGHMVLVAANRNLDMKEVLQHPLGPLPWALAKCDGTMRKTNKAALAQHLEKRVTPADTTPGPLVCIINGMSLLHKVNAESKTYGELASTILASTLHVGSDSKRKDIVFDTYRDVSIKNAEWETRKHGHEMVIANVASGHKIL
jgi:hypothetical protein